jgi:hypothetical protein
MKTYLIFRREGWSTPEDLEAGAKRSGQVGDEEMSDQVRWLRSYVLAENGKVGTVCVYQAVNAEAIREHAERAKIPADEVVEVLDTVYVRPDPQPLTA